MKNKEFDQFKTRILPELSNLLMEGKILLTVILLALAITLPGCGFMGVTHFEMWKGGPNWDNVVNQKWSISTEELPSAAIKHFRK